MCQPKAETWDWICVTTCSIPGARSPDMAFTICHALTRSSNSNPAPLVDRSVAEKLLAIPLAGAFRVRGFLEEVIRWGGTSSDLFAGSLHRRSRIKATTRYLFVASLLHNATL